ncbi:MAG TPA: hypothetical protein PLH94_02570 [Fimbriimonadaceae bacterium]|nr:hypothetical protein [Fimbriimonadaceae bacterium]
MARWKENDRVHVIDRPVTLEDRKSNRYFEHMVGQVGTVQAVYGPDEVAVKVDPEALSKVAREVHTESTKRMRDRFLGMISEEQKGKLTPEELAFHANYVLLVRSDDLEKA